MVDTAGEALKIGASDYLQKPIRVEELDIILSHLLDYGRLRRDNTLLRMELESRLEFMIESENKEIEGSELHGIAARGIRDGKGSVRPLYPPVELTVQGELRAA